MKSFLFLILAVFTGSVMAQDQFPLRKEFPKIPIIELADAHAKHGNVIFVDVRSKIEFETVHVNRAKHIPYNNPSLFINELAKVRSKNDAKTIVFYCNGIKCKKSFEAAEMAIKEGYQNVVVMDSGILNWTKKYPEKSFLMGQSPADPKKLIADDAFKARLLKLDAFKQGAEKPNSIIYDVRDSTQIKKKLDIKNIRYLPLNDIVPLIKKGNFKDKELYFADAVGKQVDWLQYYLEESGYKNYFFLSGGVDGN